MKRGPLRSAIVVVGGGLFVAAIALSRGWPMWAAGVVCFIMPYFTNQIIDSISAIRIERARNRDETR